MTKKFFSVFIALVMVLSMFPMSVLTVGAAGNTYGGGLGTKEDPYKIATREDFEAIATAVNGGDQLLGVYFVQTADIDMGGQAQPWPTIGNTIDTAMHRFRGVFDGQNYKVSNLYVDRYDDDTGLFGCVGPDGVVRNVHVVEGEIYGTYWVGGIVARNYGLVEYCSFSGYVYGSQQFAGGIVGDNHSGGIVRYCHNLGDVECNQFVGGVVGRNLNSTVENCYNEGNVLSNHAIRGYAGGIVGENTVRSTINNCYSSGYVEGSFACGAITGANGEGSSIEDCFYPEWFEDEGLEGVGSSTGHLDNVTSRPDEDFESGAITWELFHGNDGSGWGQFIDEEGEGHPVFSEETNRKVYRVTFTSDNPEYYEVHYVNTGATVVSESSASEVSGNENAQWYVGYKVYDGTNIHADIDAVAGIRYNFSVDNATEHTFTAFYDQIIKLDLNQWMSYADGAAISNQFAYEIETYDSKISDELKANIQTVDSYLAIPGGLTVNDEGYTFTIKVIEKEPYIKTPAGKIVKATVDDSLELATATVSVKINIEKATPLITVVPDPAEVNPETKLNTIDISKSTATNFDKNVEGTFEWDDGDTIVYAPDSERTAYVVNFTPADENNYNPATGTTTLKVNKPKIAESDITPPVGINSVYTGDAQALIATAGSYTHGSAMVYSLSADSDWSTEYPVLANAGEYTVYYKVTGDENYEDSDVYSVTATITPKPINIPDTEVIYNGGKEFTVNLTGVQDRTIVATLTASSKDVKNAGYAYAADEATATGDYYTVKLSNDNYVVGENNGTLKINPLTAVLEWSKEVIFNHDGKDHGVTAIVTNGINDDEFNLTIRENKAKDKGDYTAEVTDLGNPNYVLDPTNATQKWYIIAEDVYVTMQDQTVTYGENVTLTVNFKTADGSDIPDTDIDNETVDFYINGSDTPVNSSPVSLTDNVDGTATATIVVSATWANKFSAGQNTVKAKYSGTNFDEDEAYATVTVNPKEITPEISGTEKTFDGNNVALNLVIEVDSAIVLGDDVDFVADSCTYNSENVDEAKTITVSGALVGEQASNYTINLDGIKGRINPKTIKITWNGWENLVYTGEPANVTATLAELIPGIDCTVTVEGGNAVDVGNHTATATLSTGNYALAKGDEKKDYTINPGDPTIDVQTTTYGDGKTLKDVELPAGWSWDNPNTLVGDVGIANFPASYTPVDNKYKAAEHVTVTVIVKPAKAEVTLPQAIKGLVYNGEEQTLIIDGSVDIAIGDIFYNLNGSDVYGLALPKGTNAGTYTVYYKVICDGNHYTEVEAGTITVTIDKATPVLDPAPAAITGLVYNGQAQELFTEGSAIGGTILYSDSKDGPFSEKLAFTGKNAGDYKLWYMVKGDENYKDIAPVSVTANIDKAYPNVTPPGGLTGTQGGKLSDVDLPKGFEWADPNTRFTEQGEHKFDAVYTPDDPNYKSVHVSVTVTVGEYVDDFECKMCPKYYEHRDDPVVGIFYRFIHFFVHLAHKIGRWT